MNDVHAVQIVRTRPFALWLIATRAMSIELDGTSMPKELPREARSATSALRMSALDGMHAPIDARAADHPLLDQRYPLSGPGAVHRQRLAGLAAAEDQLVITVDFGDRAISQRLGRARLRRHGNGEFHALAGPHLVRRIGPFDQQRVRPGRQADEDGRLAAGADEMPGQLVDGDADMAQARRRLQRARAERRHHAQMLAPSHLQAALDVIERRLRINLDQTRSGVCDGHLPDRRIDDLFIRVALVEDRLSTLDRAHLRIEPVEGEGRGKPVAVDDILHRGPTLFERFRFP